jgi:hypothetical protein
MTSKKRLKPALRPLATDSLSLVRGGSLNYTKITY